MDAHFILSDLLQTRTEQSSASYTDVVNLDHAHLSHKLF